MRGRHALRARSHVTAAKIQVASQIGRIGGADRSEPVNDDGKAAYGLELEAFFNARSKFVINVAAPEVDWRMGTTRKRLPSDDIEIPRSFVFTSTANNGFIVPGRTVLPSSSSSTDRMPYALR